MDVRCEKCGTEYELDDSRLKPAGVSVKCTTCGHVFRVRRHPITSVGVGSDQALPPAPRRPDTERDMEPLPPMLNEDEPEEQRVSDTIPIPTMTAGPTPGPRMVRMTPSSARSQARRSKERNWLVRLPSGDIETCRELATLHQWIIAGKVTRNSGISRTGKSWKRLGEIRELEPFFDVAEETRRGRMSETPGTPGAVSAGTKTGAKPAAKTEAQARVEAVLHARQMPRVIQPIPDSFSASGPVDARPEGGADGRAEASPEGSSDEAWEGPGTAESLPPVLDEPEPEPPLLPAGAGRPAGAALGAGAGAGAKRTLLGVAGGPAGGIPAYGMSFAGDDDEGPTEEVDVVLALAMPSLAPTGQAGDQPGGETRAAPDDDDDEPAPATRAEDMPRNPLDRKLPRTPELAPAGPGTRSPAAGELTGRSGPGMASTLRGPAPVPMAPAGRAATGPVRADDGAPAAPAPAAPAPERANGRDAGAPGAGPAARLHAAAQDAASWRASAAAPGALDDTLLADPSDPRGHEPGARIAAGPAAASGAEFEGPRRLGRGALAHAAATEGAIGPTAGLARRSAVQDVAFAGGKIRALPDDAGNETLETRPVPTSSRAGRWIVVVALVLMAASAAVVYMFVFRPTGDSIDGLALGGDAGSEDPGAPDGGAGEAEAAEAAKLTELVRTRLAMDTQAGLEELDEQLEAAGDAMLAERARVHTALAQHLFDGAALAGSDATRAGELERKGQALVLAALTMAQRALQKDREDLKALVAMADVQRLQGREVRQVENYLVTALAREPERREARLVRALAQAASERTRKDARVLLEALAGPASGVDVRPGYRLALLDLAEAHPEDARRRATEVLAVSPGHEGARALLAHLDATPVVDTTDPMPVEETPSPAPEGNGRDPGGRGDDDGDKRGGSYDDLVARADKKAKAKDCDEAMELYERALDDNPSGVSALLGMAECHVQRQEFASAYGKLQAVLGVSPSHAEAMWRMAEAYRKQGLDAQAVSWYRKYVEEHPSGPRASKARQRIDELGASAPSPGPGGGSGAGGGSGTEPPAGGGSGTEPPAGGGSTEPPAGQGDPPPAPGSGGGDTPGSTAD
jgi:predicted Zn finger-like uncharacterized protein